MLKKFSLAAILVLLSMPLSFADFPTDVTILDKPQIAKLTDDQLIDNYENTVVEIEAMNTFHVTSGFSSIKQYEEYKAMLKFRLQLLVEIHNRNLEVPNFNQ